MTIDEEIKLKFFDKIALLFNLLKFRSSILFNNCTTIDLCY